MSSTWKGAPMKKKENPEERIRELQIKIRMANGMEIMDSFVELAQVYESLDRLYEAESALSKALALAEREMGKENVALIPILDVYSFVLARMNRKIESGTMRKRADEIRKSQRQKR